MKINYVWSVGQGVKTPPFHGGNAGSNPARIMFWRHSQVVRQRSATPLSPVRIRVAPLKGSGFIAIGCGVGAFFMV